MDARRTVEVVWRMHSARLVAALARLVQDLGLAEDVAQDAFLCALEQWPERGVPDDPAAWLMTTARRRAIDLIRRERSRDHKYAQLGGAAHGTVRHCGRRPLVARIRRLPPDPVPAVAPR
jgi:predicted RNA polymerase sigma factor